MKGKKTRPSITPDDPDKAFKVIWENFTPEGKAYVEHQSQANDGVETELAREEMMNEGKLETSDQQLENQKPEVKS